MNHVVRHSVCSNIVTLGFNESVASAREFSLRALKQNYGELLPRYTKDFRYCKKIPKSWLKVRPDLNPEVINQKYCLLKQTDFFKNFPFPETIGVWTLPSMFLAGNVALSKNAFTKVGGFDLRFRGWGMEDTHLGYKLINSGLFLVPVLSCTAFHIRDSIRKQVGRRGEFKENIALYNKLVERGSVTQVREWADRMQKTLKNKFKVVYK